MSRRIYFSIREYPEVLSLLAIISFLPAQEAESIEWRVFPSPVNTDFDFLSLEESLRRNRVPASVALPETALRDGAPIYGFKTDMQHSHDELPRHLFDIREIMAARLYRHEPLKIWNDERILVVGNVKIRSPVEEFQREIFDRLAGLPYRVIVVPRHPIPASEMMDVVLPAGITLVNTMGDLEGFHARADAVIMGRIFCAGDLVSDDDHNPFEATINANALAGVNTAVPGPYEWIYRESGLIRQCTSYDEVFRALPEAMDDGSILAKLERRRAHVLSNREKISSHIRERLSV